MPWSVEVFLVNKVLIKVMTYDIKEEICDTYEEEECNTVTDTECRIVDDKQCRLISYTSIENLETMFNFSQY